MNISSYLFYLLKFFVAFPSANTEAASVTVGSYYAIVSFEIVEAFQVTLFGLMLLDKNVQ